MPQEKRLIILVPTERDQTDKDYREKYWVNFVWHVRQVLAREGVDCRIVTADAEDRQS